MQDGFTFDGHSADLKRGEVMFSFTLVRAGEKILFTEKINFEPAKTEVPMELLERIFQNIALAIGITYWKLTCPAEIDLGPYKVSSTDADFWQIIYTKGLGEFAYRNKLDLFSTVQFPSNSDELLPLELSESGRSLLFIGGGKDSIVAAELLKVCGKQFDGFAKDPEPLQKEVADLVGAPLKTITRTIDPAFFEVNKRDDVHRGHVPISLIYALLGLLEAVLHDYTYLIVANEESANYGNVEYLGHIINHQWSKSAEFEKLFRDHIYSHVSPNITYFSLMRPFTELAIVKEFVKYPKYFETFSSCNTNFKQHKEPGQALWCGKCPKCAFVFVALAAFLPKDTVVNIFKKNLFADADLKPLYRELLGLKGFKPFECVGTPQESQLAFLLAHERAGYTDNVIMRMFLDDFAGKLEKIKKTESLILSQKDSSNIPDEFKRCIAS